ncbi:hypothetical protein DERP_002042 [Dermatophagoides pteronyssinus]|uniref:Uncharacterized protein n=1 Tax=Dermatophagoides pteronyssinus TaxID=6956 RepID=A0ABQ8JGP9_DERPT|nr:hypothetical protein DERP_002042 [Dermatophagoides pteronyssinus]
MECKYTNRILTTSIGCVTADAKSPAVTPHANYKPEYGTSRIKVGNRPDFNPRRPSLRYNLSFKKTIYLKKHTGAVPRHKPISCSFLIVSSVTVTNRVDGIADEETLWLRLIANDDK